MATAFEFDLVSPEALLVSESVDMVTVPGAAGEFGVLAHHVPTIAALKNGVVRVWKDDKVLRRIFISGGFCEVTGDRCAVLTEEAVAVDELDASKLEDEIKGLEYDLEKASGGDARVLEGKLQIARAKLKAIAH
ncbi:MAG: F0F1 ATP synthase subunit epsilon [Alphaproteobacteria bacterium]